MIPHDYLVLAIAAFWLVTGLLGLTFTIRRLRHRQTASHGQQTPVYWPPAR
jgi:hypothetical protein